jgi:hypothetical protein
MRTIPPTTRRLTLVAVGLVAALLPALACGASAPPVPTIVPPPTLAPLPTYTPQATATERPTYTPQPTATPASRTGTLSITPNQIELHSIDALGQGPPITVIGSGLPRDTEMSIMLEDANGNNPRPLNGALPPLKTDHGGSFTWNGPLGNIQPGTYIVAVVTHGYVAVIWETYGPTLAKATLLVSDPPAPGAKPGEFCFLPGNNGCIDMGAMMGSLLMGSLSWWNGFQAGGRAALAGGIVPAILQQPDLTSKQYSPLGTFLHYFILFGKAALSVLISMRVVAYVVDLFRLKPMRAALILMGEIVLVYWYASILTTVEHAVWTWVQDAVVYIGKDALKPLNDALTKLTTINKSDMASLVKFTVGVLVSLALLVVMVVMFGIIVLTRIGTLVLLVALFIIAPLCIPLVLLSATRPIFFWWFKSIVALSALPVVYVIEISAGVAFVFALTGSTDPHDVFNSPLVHVAAGVALVAVLLAAPELTTEAVSRIGGGAGRALNIARNPALAAATKAQSKVRSLAPSWL